MNLLVKNYSEVDFFATYAPLEGHPRILNAGSSSVRYGANCVNIDIQAKPNVDVVCDMHTLPDSLGSFDVVVCNAALQYCHSPAVVAHEFRRVLKPGGYLYVDAPWVQPYCPDTLDRYRFSQDALKGLFSEFEILEMGPSIRPGSALAMLGVEIAQTLTKNRYVNFALGKAAAGFLFPLRWLRTSAEARSAGGFYLVARKPA